MSARSIWNGTLTFGAVAIPVKLFSATESRGLSFREVRESDGARIAHKRVGAESGEEVAFADTVKGYDDGRGLVVLTKDEIAAADGPRPKVVAIEHFVRAEEIDPVFYDKPYHLGANRGGEHAYRVLLAALERSERVGIGRFVLRSREQLVAVRPLDGALGLQTMRFDDELVDPDDLELPSLKKEPKPREVDMAEKLVEMMVSDWDPDEHVDTYRESVMELIERKRTGRKPKRAAKREETGDDLAAALEASLAGGPKAKRGGAKGGAAKRGGAQDGAAQDGGGDGDGDGAKPAPKGRGAKADGGATASPKGGAAKGDGAKPAPKRGAKAAAAKAGEEPGGTQAKAPAKARTKPAPEKAKAETADDAPPAKAKRPARTPRSPRPGTSEKPASATRRAGKAAAAKQTTPKRTEDA